MLKNNLKLRTIWKPLHQLKVGDKIAVTNITPGVKEVPTPGVELSKSSEPEKIFFDEIVSIKSLGKQPVMDIEIENTHNFVGNQIIAHNTVVTGNIGIGTTNPNYKLEVASTPAGSGSIAADYFLDLGNTSYGIDPSGTNNAYLGVGYSLKITGGALLAADSGNVGIGTTDPGAYKLNVQGRLYANAGIQLETSGAANTDFQITRGANSKASFSVDGSNPGQLQINAYNGSAYGPILLTSASGAAGVVRFISGNVGIGTMEPTRILGLGGLVARNIGMERGTVANTAGFNLTLNAGGATLAATDKAGGNLLLSSGISTGTGGSEIQFWTASTKGTGTEDNALTQKMVIDTDGKVGIGTAGPLSKLGVLGNLSVGATYGAIAAPTSGMIIEGNLGIGTTNPGPKKLYLSGGTAYCDQASCWNQASDIAFKRNIQKLEYGLDEVMLMNPSRYDFTISGTSEIGFVAQELELIIPEVVLGENGSKGISYGSLTPILVKAIQQQQDQISKIKSDTTIQDLKTQVLGKELNQKVETISKNLTTGLIKTTTLIADQIYLQGQSLQAYITGVVEEILANLPGSEPDSIISPVASIDQLTVVNATISGTLTADKIESSTIDIMRQKIEDIVARLNQPAAVPPDSSTIDVNTLNTLYELLNSQTSATDSAQSLNLASIEADFGFFKDYLAVLGKAVITDLTVTNNLNVASIDSPTGSLSLLAGLMVLDQSGNVLINGNLTVNGEILAQKVTAPQGHFEDLLAQKLTAEEIKVGQLIIASDATASAEIATNSASITTNATAGKATLPAGLTQFTINTPHVDNNTLAYVTPIGDSQNQVLYVKAKEACTNPTPEVGTSFTSEVCSPWFTIAINTPLPHDLEFNWWIIKLEPEKAI